MKRKVTSTLKNESDFSQTVSFVKDENRIARNYILDGTKPLLLAYTKTTTYPFEMHL